MSSIASDAPCSASQAMASVRSLTQASRPTGRTCLCSHAAASRRALRDERQQGRTPRLRHAVRPARLPAAASTTAAAPRPPPRTGALCIGPAPGAAPARHARPADALAAIVNPPHESATVPLTHHGRSCARGISRARPATAELERFATGDGPTRQAGACAEGASGTRATFTVPDKARDRGAAAIQRSRGPLRSAWGRWIRDS